MNEVNTSKTNTGDVVATTMCPSDDTLTLFVERQLPDSQMAVVAEHIATCPVCKSEVMDLAEWLASGKNLDVNAATSDERCAVDKALEPVRARRARELWQRVFLAVRPAHEYLAAADGQTADQIQQRNARAGILHFVSTPPPPHKDAWHVKVTLPAETGSDEAHIRLQVFDVGEKVVPSGVLTFCGVDLHIEDGYAFMPIGEFRKNMHVALIKLKRGDGEPIPGVLAAAYGI